MKYAFSKDVITKNTPPFTLMPWKLMGAKTFNTVKEIPDDYILVASHFAPWWEPLKSYIAEKRPYIEIEYGYWGIDNPRRQTRRVTYCGHHNLNLKHPPYKRSDLFFDPAIQEWNLQRKDYILGIEPVGEILLERTGESIPEFRSRLENIIAPYYSGPIVWRKKYGAKFSRFSSLRDQVKDAYAVVGERTMACVEACLLGTPGFTIDRSMTTLLMGDISNLKNLTYPDRTQWFEHICWSQFTNEEFFTVKPAELTEQYQII